MLPIICWSSGGLLISTSILPVLRKTFLIIDFKIIKILFYFPRFEYLWPFWLLVRSIYDSFKYQGLVRAIFYQRNIYFNKYLFSGFFSFLHLYCPHQRHDLLSLHTSPLAFLRGQYLRLGSVCLAYRFGFIDPI